MENYFFVKLADVYVYIRIAVDALRKICEINGIKPLVERSHSGKGAHVWIFFKKAIPASVVRNFGFLLLDKGSASII